MTATVTEIPHEIMVHITDHITHEVAGINRVLYDFTPKPTGTAQSGKTERQFRIDGTPFRFSGTL